MQIFKIHVVHNSKWIHVCKCYEYKNINYEKKKYCMSVLILFLTFTVILKRGGIHPIHEDKTEL